MEKNDLQKNVKRLVEAGVPENEIAKYIQEFGDGKKSAAPSLMPSHSPELKASHSAQLAKPSLTDVLRQSVKTLKPLYRPALEGGGAFAGSAIGALAGIETGPGALVTGAIGAGTGLAAGRQGADWLDYFAEGGKAPIGKEAYSRTLGALSEGATYEMLGPSLPAAVGLGARTFGKVAKPVLGRLSGVGTGAVNEAMQSSAMFNKALRGKIKPEEIVANAKGALQSLVDARGTKYRQALTAISKTKGPVDTRPITKTIKDLCKKYNISISRAPNGEMLIDSSRIAMGKKGRKDIEEILQSISNWGSRPGDTSPLGMDTLKRQLDDFYSESSQARQFVTSLKNKVIDTISASVPEYKTMLSEYSEATGLIKDIESGLVLRKQGMTGRVVADQTLRRLLSSMRDNYALRKELVEVLGNKAGVDLGGQIAGYAMRSPIPVGLAGTGPMLAGQAAFAFVNPKFWPVLAASSPRVQAEFLSKFGKLVQAAAKTDKMMMQKGLTQYLIYRNRQKENR